MEVQEAQKQLDALETLSSKNLKLVLAKHSVGFEGVVELEGGADSSGAARAHRSDRGQR